MKVSDLVRCKIFNDRVGIIVAPFNFPALGVHWYIWWHDMSIGDDYAISPAEDLEAIGEGG